MIVLDIFVFFQVYAPLFDKIISERHNGYKPSDKHHTDLDYTKVRSDTVHHTHPQHLT